jgi:hypothetical protein
LRKAECDVDWHQVQVIHGTTASDYLRAVRLIEEPKLTLALWEATPVPLRWRLSREADDERRGVYLANRRPASAPASAQAARAAEPAEEGRWRSRSWHWGAWDWRADNQWWSWRER